MISILQLLSFIKFSHKCEDSALLLSNLNLLCTPRWMLICKCSQSLNCCSPTLLKRRKMVASLKNNHNNATVLGCRLICNFQLAAHHDQTEIRASDWLVTPCCMNTQDQMEGHTESLLADQMS